jgi:glucose/arabinose dehydrogenase
MRAIYTKRRKTRKYGDLRRVVTIGGISVEWRARAPTRPRNQELFPMNFADSLRRSACAATLFLAAASARAELPLELIKLPEGFKIELYAQDLPNARSLAIGAKGTIFVSTRNKDVVYAVRDEDGDQKADKTYVVAKGLDTPNGVAFHNGALYVPSTAA